MVNVHFYRITEVASKCDCVNVTLKQKRRLKDYPVANSAHGRALKNLNPRKRPCYAFQMQQFKKVGARKRSTVAGFLLPSTLSSATTKVGGRVDTQISHHIYISTIIIRLATA